MISQMTKLGPSQRIRLWWLLLSLNGTDTDPSEQADAPDDEGPVAFALKGQTDPLDKDSFEALYLAEEKPLYNTVYRWVWHEAEAMDLVQDAFIRLWRVRHKVYRIQAKAYVYRIALNLATNRLRSKKLWQWTGLEGLLGKTTTDAKLLRNEREHTVRAAVMALPEKIRRVIVMVRFADMSYKEIASVLDIPIGTVGSRHNKGLLLLEQNLKRYEQGS